jgi:hypothetical protein
MKSPVFLYWDGKTWTEGKVKHDGKCGVDEIVQVGTELYASDATDGQCALKFDSASSTWVTIKNPGFKANIAGSAKTTTVWAGGEDADKNLRFARYRP